MIRWSAAGERSTPAVVRLATRTGLSSKPSSVAPPAIATLKHATIASSTMLQFSSRILMPGKRGRGRVVPANRVDGRADLPEVFLFWDRCGDNARSGWFFLDRDMLT